MHLLAAYVNEYKTHVSLPIDSESLECTFVGTIGSSLSLFLRDGTAEGRAVGFDAMFNRPPAISLTWSIRSTHLLLCYKNGGKGMH